MLLLLIEATTEEKKTLVGTILIPGTTEDHQLFMKFWIMHQNTPKSIQTVKKRQENLEWEGVTGSLTSSTVNAKFD